MRTTEYRKAPKCAGHIAKAAAVIAAVFILCAEAIPVNALEQASLDEDLALGLYGDNAGASSGGASSAGASSGSASSGGASSGSASSGGASNADSSAGRQYDSWMMPEGMTAEISTAAFPLALARQYRPLDGEFILERSSRFFIITDETRKPPEALKETVGLMAVEFASYGLPYEKQLPVVYGDVSETRRGDIVIDLQPEHRYMPWRENADIRQSYTLAITDRARLNACGTDGIWYGLITLLELARQNTHIGCLKITDGPELIERTIFLDCGRKYFSKEWLEAFIRRSSLQRYNAIVLHFSEAEGLRLDSEVFPWLTDNIKSLTREEMADIVKFADKYHMKVIPSIDVPGHNRFVVSRYAEYVKKHPGFSFTYEGATYDKSVKGFASIANHYSRDGVTRKVTDIGIDITKPHAVAFADALIDDYASFFLKLGCKDFDICGDEVMGWSNFMLGDNEVSYEDRWLFLEHWRNYARKHLKIRNGSASDTFINYLNNVTSRLERMGYTCRVFNDEIDINDDQHVELNSSVGVAVWDLKDNSAAHFAGKGHVVYNCVMQWSYYVVRKQKGRDIMDGRYRSVNSRNIYENWDPRSFAAKKGKKKTVPADMFGGAYFFIWCDNPSYKSAETIFNETELRTWANASRMWNPEINSGESGIRAAMPYKYMKKFARSMKK